MVEEQREKTISVIRPSIVRNRPVRFFICVIMLVFAIIPLTSEAIPTPAILYSVLTLIIAPIVLLKWLLRSFFTVYSITDRRIIAKSGILRRSTNEVRHSDIRNIQADQSVFQRVFMVGNVAISSAGQSGIELTMVGIKNPQQIVNLIRQYQN